MEEIPDPGDGCVAMLVVELHNLALDDLLGPGAALGVVIQFQATTLSCKNHTT